MPLSLDITINGMATSPVARDTKLVLLAGDTVEISANQDVIWDGSSDTIANALIGLGESVGAVSVADLQTSPRKWSGRIMNARITGAYYTIYAKAADPMSGRKIDLELEIRPQDRRNGDYSVFATNGTQQTLKLDFDRKTYKMTDVAGMSESGTFSSYEGIFDTYVFSSSRISGPTNTARFRISMVTDHVVVGTFPFAMPGGAYAVRPFVASRTPIQSPADLDGNYSGVGVSMAMMTADSSFNSLNISNQGTRMEVCTDDVLYNVRSCPSASLKRYSVSKGAAEGIWRAVNDADPADIHSFIVARMENDRVYLEAEKLSSDVFRFRIGMPGTGYLDSGYVVTAYGGATDGSWGRSVISPAGKTSFDYRLARQSSSGPGLPGGNLVRGYTRSSIGLNGEESEMSAFVGEPYALAPVSALPFDLNYQYAITTPASYFMTSSQQIFARVGPRVPGAAGYLEIGLIER